MVKFKQRCPVAGLNWWYFFQRCQLLKKNNTQTTAISPISLTQLLNELCTAELHLWRSRLVLLLRSAWQHRLGSSALYLSCFSLSSTYRWARICNENGLNSPNRGSRTLKTQHWFKKIFSQFNCAIFLKLPPSLQVFVLHSRLMSIQPLPNGIVQPLPWSEGLCKRGNFCLCFHVYHWFVFLVFPQKTIVFAVTFRYVQGVQFKFSLAPWEDANGAKPNAAHVGTARDWWWTNLEQQKRG